MFDYRVISSVNICIQLYLSVHLLENKFALQPKCKSKCDPQMHVHPLKCVHCNKNTNANEFPQVHVSSKICAL